MNERIERLKQEFKRNFGKKGSIRIFSAPGRVNLIGEHTDYNGGFVLPVNIDRDIIAVARLREGRQVNMRSKNFDKLITFNLDKIGKSDNWGDYPKAVAYILKQEGYKLKGADILFEGNIPVGAGLSSSAAIEVVSAFTFLTLSEIELDREKIALLCQRAENEFVGMRCGIMDQFVISLGKKRRALFLDCRGLKYELIPFAESGVKIVISNTMVKRGLVDSKYNERRKECEEGAKILGEKLLRDLSIEKFEERKGELPEKICKRCQHVIYEDERVKESVKMLKKRNVKDFGKLMIESHFSLRNLYEVSCDELDIMVESALEQKGVLGSRMTGAGFGGCTVSLVKTENVEEFVRKVSKEYQGKTKIKPEFYISEIEDGVKEIREC